MKKFLLSLLFIFWIGWWLLYALPGINCIVNSSTSCGYPFYERSSIERKLVLSSDDFLTNKAIYEELAKRMLENQYSSMERDAITDKVWFTYNKLRKTNTWAVNLLVNNRKIDNIFSENMIESVWNKKWLINIYKQKSARWYNPYYLFDSLWDLYKDDPVRMEYGKRIIYSNGDRAEVLWDNWYFVVFQGAWSLQ